MLLVEAQHSMRNEKLQKKKDLKSAADAEAMDVDSTSPSTSTISKLVDSAVGKSTRKLRKLLDASVKVSVIASNASTANPLTRVGVVRTQRQRQEVRRTRGSGSEGRGTSVQETRRAVDLRAAGLQEEEGIEGWEAVAESSQRKTRRRGVEGDSEIDMYSSNCSESISFRYEDPSTYPDQLLLVSLPRAVEFIITNMPLDVLEYARYRNNVHLSPGVSVPLNIQLSLSVGMKYLMPTLFNKDLIMESYVEFCNRLRWRLHMLWTKSDEVTVYDPDYDLGKPTKVAEPSLSYIEHGLECGRLHILDRIHAMPSLPSRDNAISAVQPEMSAVRQFLIEKDLIVTLTDKNLGLAVSHRQWYIDMLEQQLSNDDDYENLTELDVYNALHVQVNRMISLSLRAQRSPFGGRQLSEFLRSNCPSDGGLPHIPKFHGIPKIHKVPTKMRPIIPCHSAVINPAAKYLSKMLKPVLTDYPSIIQGSKDLAIKLSGLKLEPSRRYYICTGDVEAFYPNIPLESCLDITWHALCRKYDTALADKYVPTADTRWDPYLVHEALHAGNTGLYLQFHGKFYRQRRGLAMGVADSPDLANLYGAHFETNCEAVQSLRTAFYGRFIDDCLWIVEATSEEDALTFCRQLKFDNCNIIWEASSLGASFLDMFVFRDPTDLSRIHWRPFRKAGNHLERIPWISDHPYDVKRGTFMGEMSRLATLCSRWEYYAAALRDLANLYQARGYPTHVIKAWLKANIKERWQKRLCVKSGEEHGSVLVLKTVFNHSWDWFNVGDLGSIITRDWDNSLSMFEEDRITPELCTDTDLAFSSAIPPNLCTFAGGRTLVAEQVAELTAGTSSLTIGKAEVVGAVVGQHRNPNAMEEDGEIVEVARLASVKELTQVYNARWMTSRKRTRNLFDITARWKRQVLSIRESDIFPDVEL
jgi:hypothetical protein